MAGAPTPATISAAATCGARPCSIRFSLVCKVVTADGRPAVKLSDNVGKASGPASEIARYRRVIGAAGVHETPIQV